MTEQKQFTDSYVTAVAAIYAVLLGFVVLAVWSRFDLAEARRKGCPTPWPLFHECFYAVFGTRSAKPAIR